VDCANELPTKAGTAVRMASANANASVILLNIVILLASNLELTLAALLCFDLSCCYFFDRAGTLKCRLI
jgi:hypothetical protein